MKLLQLLKELEINNPTIDNIAKDALMLVFYIVPNDNGDSYNVENNIKYPILSLENLKEQIGAHHDEQIVICAEFDDVDDKSYSYLESRYNNELWGGKYFNINEFKLPITSEDNLKIKILKNETVT